MFVFRAKRADRIKVIVWDGTGLCLFAERLEDGTFRLAEDRGRHHAPDARTALGSDQGARLDARA